MPRISYLFIVALLNVFSVLGNETFTHHWESLFNNGDSVKYWSSNSGEPDNEWRNINFNDDTWTGGVSGVGYGDNDDGTTISTCTGVAIRYSFNISDTSKISEAHFYVDYDDAFVAYINGVEIARSGGLTDSFPSLHTLSSSQHEAGTREVYYFNSDQFSDLLVKGNNVFTLQVHNATASSSDMSSSAWLIAGISDAGSYYKAAPSWFEAPFRFSSSNLPIILIDTENQQSIVDNSKVSAQMRIINNALEDNNINDTPTEYDGSIGIELRGNSTQNFPKKPYNLETRDSLGENNNVPLFGWRKENDWVLRASYIDHTFIRNCLAGQMSRLNGWWAPHTKLVEVVLNGNYQGIYVFMEDIKPDKGRVDIEKMTSEDTTEPELTGGYIWEITGFGYNIGQKRKLKFPKYDKATTEQINYITYHDNAFRNQVQAVTDQNYEHIYSDWINMPSFINEIMVQEGMRNGDAYGWSGYFHKDREGKIIAGPVWDFDQSSGTSSYPDDAVVDGWLFEHPSKGSTPDFWPDFYADPVFAYALRERWESLRSTSYSDQNLGNYIDSLAYLLRDAQAREFETWPVLGTNIWRETTGYQARDTHAKEVSHLKDFLTERWAWMDEKLSHFQNPNPTGLDSEASATRCHIYPNPVSDVAYLSILHTDVQNVSIEIVNQMGICVMQKNTAHSPKTTLHFDSSLPAGIYFVNITINDQIKEVKRVLKVN